MQPTWLTIADKAELAADLNDLPYDRITGHDSTAHVFTAGLGELEQWARWFLPLGCCITQQPAGTGVVLWTLRTQLGGTNPIPVQVSALALDTEQIDEDLAAAVTSTGSAA